MIETVTTIRTVTWDGTEADMARIMDDVLEDTIWSARIITPPGLGQMLMIYRNSDDSFIEALALIGPWWRIRVVGDDVEILTPVPTEDEDDE